MFLDRIIREKEKELKEKKSERYLSELNAKIKDLPASKGFNRSLNQSKEIGLIAEVKKASPSRGLFRTDFDPASIAAIYQRAGANAISVITERNFFHGKMEFLPIIKEKVEIPLLQKDFIIDEMQILEGRNNGADAVLLIAAILGKNQLSDYIDMAMEWGVEPLVEVHTEEDLYKTLSTRTEIIGINNRDLNTFETDINNTLRLIGSIPERYTVVSESGINSREDVLLLKGYGIDAILVGEALIRSNDLEGKVKELLVG